MSFNLPANRLLKVTKGNWQDVNYPADIIMQAELTPKDYFEPVERDASRSCVPANGKDFSYIFDSNTGRLMLRGETMMPQLSVTFHINDAWKVVFIGRVMQVRQKLESKDDLNATLTHFEYTLPSLLSVQTGIPIFCETVEIGLGDKLEARSETFIPPNAVTVIPPDSRVDELRRGIAMLGTAFSSARLMLAASYLREALFFTATSYAHNPYTHALLVVLKCAQAVEVLFGSNRDVMRERCRELQIPDDVIEREITPIVLARSTLGSAHASAFVPDPGDADVLRAFAQRATHTVRQLFLQIERATPAAREFLAGSLKQDNAKKLLLQTLRETVQARLWCVDEAPEIRHLIVPDSRLQRPS